MFKAKILFVGPNESGKTVLANFLSDISESIGGEYSPTQGVRILEFETQSENIRDNRVCEVELWDCSGNLKFDSCWPAVMKDASGVVIIFNPDVSTHLEELEMWHSAFIYTPGLQTEQCLLIAHHRPGSDAEDKRLPLGPKLSRLPLIHCSLEEEPQHVRPAFNRYLENVFKTMSESREREEMSIIT
ncbi:intraflagellar transport protein 22 homolog [Tautogolabrus adspersus]